MLISKKAPAEQKFAFQKVGNRLLKKVPVSDTEDAADAKKPGDAKEDASDKKKTNHSSNFFAKKAASTLVKGNK